MKYNVPGPRYTSYPTAPDWNGPFGWPEYDRCLASLADLRSDVPISIYVHIPFCHQRCLFCACNVIIRKDYRDAEDYVRYVIKEIGFVRNRLGHQNRIIQLHWGGGTPTFLSPEQIERLFKAITTHFEILPDSEVAMEIDPCVTSREQLDLLWQLGFNRLSMGVQDFDEDTQKAVRRIQGEDLTADTVRYCRSLGFGSINLDLIYGLPYQTAQRFADTVRRVIAISPDRVAMFSFAHVPWIVPHQNLLPGDRMPDAREKFEIFLEARRLFMESGYQSIGMDHFAKPRDSMTRALEKKQLHRNFMGYTLKPADNLVGLGMSSIGYVAQAFAQNEKVIRKYFRLLDAGQLPVVRGYRLDEDDLRRQFVIMSLMCNFEVSIEEFERRFGLSFREYFAAELPDLQPFVKDAFLEFSDHAIRATELGSLFIRNIAMVFDKFLRMKKQKHEQLRYSRTV
jgi:oxygen-independent coproporphyrinogen-3 oxidase